MYEDNISIVGEKTPKAKIQFYPDIKIVYKYYKDYSKISKK